MKHISFDLIECIHCFIFILEGGKVEISMKQLQKSPFSFIVAKHKISDSDLSTQKFKVHFFVRRYLIVKSRLNVHL